MTAQTALVLGGGGITGVAWEIGMLAGLAEAGVDLRAADVVIGTSAGSVVGAQLRSGMSLDELYERQLAEPKSEIGARIPPALVARVAWAMLAARDPEAVGRNLGRMALAARTVPEAERREVIASRLPVTDWPDRALRTTAVDAHSGEFTVFDSGSGAELVDAVAASCAVPGVWPPVTIGGRRWIDGGVRTVANADLAEGHRRVVVLAPMGRGYGPSAARQVAQLTENGSQAALVVADTAARRAFGRNPLDPARRAAAARAGRAQAAACAQAVAAVWNA
ncbi:patatin-like phospholipase family protein [Streptomyces sp. RB6PN25]|uniref:Patatin-like phospholipase family protein n=1 Tax=Streptomyces humicola TaxID=2953240 RepID=A0ABT1PQH9_9ACTN|nr:patatin-like phospholipase family protein [Streptomyces humicola]MCQ4079935.1 patatin-like phospholipase family protein [Streptomyces humicola]